MFCDDSVRAMIIVPVEAGPIATIGYAVYDEATKEGLIIDVPLGSGIEYSKIIERENLKIRHILLTHSHWDHAGGAAELSRHTGAGVRVHKSDEERLRNPEVEASMFGLPFGIEAVVPEAYLNDKDRIPIGNKHLEVRHTPGHTEGGVCFILWEESCVFSGDTLFSGSIGRCDLPGGDHAALADSLRSVLMALPDGFRVLPGHGPATTIGMERATNPFLDWQETERNREA